MFAGHIAALEVIAANCCAGLPFLRIAPADEMRALLNQRLKPCAVKFIVAVAEQDDPIGLAAILKIDMPVARHLLKRDEQIVAA